LRSTQIHNTFTKTKKSINMANENATTPAPVTPSIPVDAAKLASAEKILKDYTMYGGVAGVIPVPFIDFAAISAVQMKMCHSIGKVYGFDLSDHMLKSAIGSVVSGNLATATGKGIGMRIAKAIPIVGGIASLLVLPAMAAASTYALGKVFIVHFESGGTYKLATK
jgi:uncharacterized protein (DUF697 family)